MLDHMKKKKIGKNEYHIELLPAKKGVATAMKLNKILAPVLGAGFDAFEDSSGSGFTRLGMILVEQMDQANMVELIEELLEGSASNGQEIDIDVHFRANYGELVELLTFIIQENFQSFFAAKGLMDRFSQIKEKMFPIPEQVESQPELGS
jgi:hypothetical protein